MRSPRRCEPPTSQDPSARRSSCGRAIEGYNYPFQTPYPESWAWLIDGVGEVAERCQEHGVTLFLEHKNSEPAMKILMRNIGMTLHVIHKLRARRASTNVKVNMDWQHLLMNGESLWPSTPRCSRPRDCSATSTRTRAGAPSTTTTWSAPRRSWRPSSWRSSCGARGTATNGERLGFDLYPYTEDAVEAVRRSVLQWRFIDSVAARIDDAALREAQARKDAVRAYELVYAALGA